MCYLNNHHALILSILLFLTLPYQVLSYDGTSCCLSANATNDFANTTKYPLPSHPVCGQVFGDYDPAPSVFVHYTYCRDNCAGIGLSKPSDPGQWAGPVVQFILPAVIFSATIPRRLQLTFKEVRAHLPTWKSAEGRRWCQAIVVAILLIGKPVEMIVVFVDNLLWIFAIVTGAGPMIIGGLYEAWLDHYILESIRRNTRNTRHSNFQDIIEQRELLVILAVGNLTKEGDPIEKIITKLHVDTIDKPSTERTAVPVERDQQQKRESQARLVSLLGAQAGFGTAVGAPVLFYLGAFVYTILDLQSDPSDQDSAISLAFGVEWMVVVHVAIVGGCLLAANNPATSTAIVGQSLDPRDKPVLGFRKGPSGSITKKKLPLFLQRIVYWSELVLFYTFSDAYNTTFQPVWMWRRGETKRRAVKRSKAWQSTVENRSSLVLGWRSWLAIWISAVILVAVPPVAGAVVSYATPPIGVSCRSLSFMIYASCQVVLCTTYVFRNVWHHEFVGTEHFMTPTNQFSNLATAIRWLKWLLAQNFWNLVPLLLSGFSCVGGTVMQVVGVFRNCFCYTITDKWMHLDQAFVNLASDTEDARSSTKNWITMGITATVFMVMTAYSGWWYQQFVRRRFLDAVEKLYTGEVVDRSSVSLAWEKFTVVALGFWTSISKAWVKVFHQVGDRSYVRIRR